MMHLLNIKRIFKYSLTITSRLRLLLTNSICSVLFFVDLTWFHFACMLNWNNPSSVLTLFFFSFSNNRHNSFSTEHLFRTFKHTLKMICLYVSPILSTIYFASFLRPCCVFSFQHIGFEVERKPDHLIFMQMYFTFFAVNLDR